MLVEWVLSLLPSCFVVAAGTAYVPVEVMGLH